MIPQHFIDDLLNRVDIVEVIDARVPLKKSGREYAACCPFHNEKTPSFTVSPTKQFYHCFGCGAHGTAIGFLMEYEHMEFPEAVETLAEVAGVEVPKEARPANRPQGQRSLYSLMERVAHFYQRQLKSSPAAVEYLKGRGLSGEIAAEFLIGYAPSGWDQLTEGLGADAGVRGQLVTTGMLIRKDSNKVYDRFRDRIMFPIRDTRGRVIAFGGRVLGEGEPKYLNSPETPLFHKGRELYGLYEARQALREIPRLMVVEGYMDVVGLAQHGIRYAVATLGTATTVEHLNRLFRVTSEVVFCFDGDRAGRQAAWRALENALPGLQDGRQIRFLFLPEGEDPDSLVRSEGREAFEARLATARPLSDFFFDHLAAQVDESSIEGRARLVELARPLLERVPESAYRQMLMDRLAQSARVDSRRLAMLIRKPQVSAEDLAGPRPARRLAMTPVRKAIVMLLCDPALAQTVETPRELLAAGLPGLDLLVELVEFLREQPHSTAATVLEHFRERREAGALARLAAEDLQLEGEALAGEFRGLIGRLRRRVAEQRLEHLTA
ncbi:MAG: DNA primase, partial [Gammaproteobacteria bacterium]